MLTVSKPLAVSQAQDYYRREYTSPGESYYAEGEEIAGRWHGRLAEQWGLRGEVRDEQYERLCNGQHPETGEQLVRHLESRTYLNRYGKEITTSGHRAGWDATFSAPKTVSLAAVTGGDERVRVAHRESVDAALDALEPYTQARMGGNRPAEMTGKMVAAKFEHTAARPDQLTGYAAPQLHTHVVIFNVTETESGATKPVQPLELYRGQQYATAVYRINLAERLHRLGYEVEVDPRTGAPEIKGFDPEYVRESSPRSAEVRRGAEEMKARLEGEGASVKEGAGLRQAAARVDRAGKEYDRREMRERALEMDAKYGHQAERLYQAAVERGPVMYDAEEVGRRAREAVTFARENAVEREAVVDRRKVLVDAFRRNLGLTTYEAVRNELAEREARGEFVSIIKEHEPRRSTTDRMLRMEEENVRRVLDGRGALAPMLESGQARERVEEAAARRGVTLNAGQRAAVEQIVTSGDRVMGLQGGAGTGKSTTLAAVREVAEGAGYEVRGFAPTTRAAKTLAESGIETETLQKFLSCGPHAGEESARRLYVLDESSLASTRNLHQFLKRVGPEDRVLLVGDARQHQAVEAGSPFEQLRRHGMATTELTEIVRQRDPGLRRAVEELSAGEVKAAVERLQADGRVVEIPDAHARLRAIAADYCARPDGTLVIAPANRERVALNTMIHDRLRREGKLGDEEQATKVYVNRQDMTGAERTFAGSYVPGEDVVRFNRGSRVYGVRAGDYARVTATDREKNMITAMMEDGRELTYNPARLQGVSVYREGERLFSEGDRVQFRAPFKKHRIAGGELGTVSKIEGDRFGVRLDDRRSVSFDAGSFRHLDHGYAVTSYSSQGQTVDRVLVHADTREREALLNRRMGYVALSRGRDEARVYTNDAGALSEALDRSVDKQTALEATMRGREALSHGAQSMGAEGLGTETALSQAVGLELAL